MTDTLHAALARELGGTPLEAAFALRANEALEIDSPVEPGSPAARGLARALASNAEATRYLAHRPALLDEIANAPPDDLKRRAERLPAALEEEDLEAALDRLRLFRRDETLRTACLDLGGAIPFEAASDYLSRVAEPQPADRDLEISRLIDVLGSENLAEIAGPGALARRQTVSDDICGLAVTNFF